MLKGEPLYRGRGGGKELSGLNALSENKGEDLGHVILIYDLSS